MTLSLLRHAAAVADAAYSSELWRRYGKSAGIARHRPRHSDPGVEAAAVAKILADEDLRVAWEEDTARVKANTPAESLAAKGIPE